MALAVLDGNQSATFLSSVVTGGEHIVAHSVVSFGSNAISNIATAVSGTTVCVGSISISGTPSVTGSVSVLNFPASQTTTFGAVTGSVSVLNFPASQSVTFGQAVVSASNITGLNNSVGTDGSTPASTSFIKIGGHQDGSNSVEHIVHVSAGGAMKVDASDSTVTFGAIRGTVTIGNTVTIAGTVTANPTGTQTIAGTVTVGQIQGYQHATAGTSGPYNADVILVGEDIESSKAGGLVVIPAARDGGVLGGRTSQGDAPICVYGDNGGAVTISGTVTIGSALPAGTNRIGVVTIGNIQRAGDGVQTSLLTEAGSGYLLTKSTLNAGSEQIGSVTASISGTVPISISSVTVGNSVTIGSLPSISGTVTANTFALQGTAVTTSNFTSTTASTVLANFNATREVLTIFNEGAGNLHICAGATCTTIAYQVRLSAGDYYEVPNHQTTITHSAVFATAGTARIVQIS